MSTRTVMPEPRPQPRNDDEAALATVMRRALERVAKWRSIFAGWQLGTRPKGEPESDAVRDHREATILLRVEVSALAALLIDKGVFTTVEWTRAIAIEADALNDAYERRFPGVSTSQDGLTIDRRAAEWMKDWKP